MLDFHYVPEGVSYRGVGPILFSIGGIHIYSYPFFSGLGFAVGIFVYLFLKKEGGISSDDWRPPLVAFGSIFGGILGAVLFANLLNIRQFFTTLPFSLFSSRTMTGGILGGTFGAKVVKAGVGVRERFGNLFAPALAIGIAIGRLGCFFRGCCFGVPTGCRLGVDFGDGVLRHPTQLYESVFMLGLFLYLMSKRKTARPGELFVIFGITYFGFRFFEEFLRVSPHILGLTLFQWLSLIGILVFSAGLRDIWGKQEKKDRER